MIFNTFQYFLCFLIPASLLFQFGSSKLRPWICALSGALFFIYFSLTSVGGLRGALCLFLILYQSFFCLKFCKPNSKRCLFSVVQSILILSIFKYSNFFSSIFFHDPKSNPLYWKDIFLPLGISFFTFEFIHYAIDRYKGETETPSAGDFLAFILFFPTMVAGPIKRIQDFLPKLQNPSEDRIVNLHRGLTRILVGLAKKFMIADFLTALTNHLNAADIGAAHSRGLLLLWIFAYGFKIYFDFAAYSDIAIGSARLFGIQVPENFQIPYSRRNIAVFWQNWHISLYQWLFRYVYIPLGGSRVSPINVFRNLILVMLVSGIWHGAGWNFLVWGLWHAMLLCLHRLWSRGSLAPRLSTAPGVALFSWAITFVSVNLGWAFFAMDFPTAITFFRRLVLG